MSKWLVRAIHGHWPKRTRPRCLWLIGRFVSDEMCKYFGVREFGIERTLYFQQGF